MNTKDVRLEPTPPKFVEFCARRVRPFARAWALSFGEMDLIFLLASVYAQGVRDAERVEDYKRRKEGEMKKTEALELVAGLRTHAASCSKCQRNLPCEVYEDFQLRMVEASESLEDEPKEKEEK